MANSCSGQSETVAAAPAPYAEDHARLRIYRRLPGHRTVPHAWPKVALTTREPVARSSETAMRPRRAAAAAGGRATASAESILLGLDVGVVVVDPRYDIVRINTAARRILGIHGTAFDQDFIHLADALPSSGDPDGHRRRAARQDKSRGLRDRGDRRRHRCDPLHRGGHPARTRAARAPSRGRSSS